MQQQRAFLMRIGAEHAALRLDHITEFEAEFAKRQEPMFVRLNELSATMMGPPENQRTPTGRPKEDAMCRTEFEGVGSTPGPRRRGLHVRGRGRAEPTQVPAVRGAEAPGGS
jgi:hypothetical protein